MQFCCSAQSSDLRNRSVAQTLTCAYGSSSAQRSTIVCTILTLPQTNLAQTMSRQNTNESAVVENTSFLCRSLCLYRLYTASRGFLATAALVFQWFSFCYQLVQFAQCSQLHNLILTPPRSPAINSDEYRHKPYIARNDNRPWATSLPLTVAYAMRMPSSFMLY